jgi:ribulose-phosphate 3-epimerase
MHKHRIFASLMAADYRRLAEEVAAAEQAGVDGFHCDIMDGNFVPNITFGPGLVRALRPLTKLPFDCHLMVVNTDLMIPLMVEAGANRVSVHPEAGGHLQRSLTHIRALGAQPGVALNPSTPPEAIEYVLDDIDHVLVMSVNPGFSGQEFIPASCRKIEALARMIAASGREVRIAVDGAVVPDNVGELARLGANDFITGVPLFGHRPLEARVKQYREALR